MNFLNKENNKDLIIKDKLNISENNKKEHVRGHVILKDHDTGKVLVEKDNLVLLRTRVWLFEQLFKTTPPTTYSSTVDNDRQIALLTIGQGGADVNATAFSPYVPKFDDKALGQKVPFIIVNPDKDNDSSLKPNPSVVQELSEDQKNVYYLPETEPDGSIYYYGKRPTNANANSPYGNSKGWNIDQSTGEVSFSIEFSIGTTDARGYIINELGLFLAHYDKGSNTYTNSELATRITFDSESMNSLTKTLDIEYILYI